MRSIMQRGGTCQVACPAFLANFSVGLYLAKIIAWRMPMRISVFRHCVSLPKAIASAAK